MDDVSRLEAGKVKCCLFIFTSRAWPIIAEHCRTYADEHFNVSTSIRCLHKAVDVSLSGTGPASFNQLRRRQQQTGNGVPERFPVMRTDFVEESPLFEVHQVDSDHFPQWRRQAGSSIPRRFLVWRACLLDGLQLSEGGPVDFGFWTYADWSRMQWRMSVYLTYE